MNKIDTSNAPKAIGPYSQAISSNGFLFVSGQIPIDPKTNQVVEGGIIEQANQSFKNIGEILKAAGLDYSNVIKTTVFVKDLKDFATVNEIYSKYFISNPARSCVEVSKLPKGVLIETEAIAVK
ncbi:MAG: RidA family protein [Acholeplasmatales bacterium]|nr:RidA family protein [Acholeplasmatales bacterium]